ncbi:MAG: biopolymer transporter ExbD [Elusimicrobiota bacterium]
MAGAQKGPEDAITDINVTPLVDVSLVLVIIFMAIAPFGLQAGIKVMQSKAGAAVGKTSASQNVTLKLEKDGKITINGREVDFVTLRPLLQDALAKSKDKMVILTADDQNRVGQVVNLLDASRQAGAQKMAIMRNSKPQEKEETAETEDE